MISFAPRNKLSKIKQAHKLFIVMDDLDIKKAG